MHSDDLGASKRIEDFGASDERWMVAVRMVSEGVDVPRLAVGVYATSTSTPLFFAQAVGRFVRARRRGETASVFLPSVPSSSTTPRGSRSSATTRSTASPTPTTSARCGPRSRACSTRPTAPTRRAAPSTRGLRGTRVRRPLRPRALRQAAVGHARPDRLRGRGGVPRLPGLREPAQVSALLRERQSRQVRKAPQGASAPMPVAAHRALAAQRKELNKLVSTYARQKGLPHANVHMDLAGCAAAPTSRPRRRTRSRSASTRSGSGSSDVADGSRSARLPAPFGPDVGLGSPCASGASRAPGQGCSDRAPNRRRTT